MISWVELLVTVFCAALASTGLWTFILKKSEKKDAKTKLLLGIAHDRIVYLGLSYLKRGYISEDEYENLVDYLYEPYEKLGGNGFAKKIVDKVKTELEVKG